MKVEIKLARRHPANKMRLGRHIVTNKYEVFELNDSEVKEFESVGGKHWFMKNPKKPEMIKSAKEFENKNSKKKK